VSGALVNWFRTGCHAERWTRSEAVDRAAGPQLPAAAVRRQAGMNAFVSPGRVRPVPTEFATHLAAKRIVCSHLVIYVQHVFSDVWLDLASPVSLVNCGDGRVLGTGNQTIDRLTSVQTELPFACVRSPGWIEHLDGVVGVQRGVKQELPTLGPGKGAQTARGLRRRGVILKVAATLFAEYGFDSVSINQIGEEAGITGPAIYRYFASKEELLVAIYEHVSGRSSDGVNEVLLEGLHGREAIARLVDLQLGHVLEEAEKIRIYGNEDRHLPVKEAAALRAETRRQLRVWAGFIHEARPDLGREECDSTVHAVLALINSIALKRSGQTVPRSVSAHLRAMALAAVFQSAADAVGNRIPEPDEMAN
jgi:AcrR family transcriptional regulator